MCYRGVHDLAARIQRREISPGRDRGRVPATDRSAESAAVGVSHVDGRQRPGRSAARRSGDRSRALARTAARHSLRRQRHHRNERRADHARFEFFPRTSFRSGTPSASRGCAAPAPSCSARRSPTSSPPRLPPSILITGPRTIPGTWIASRAAPAADPRRRWRRGSARSRSARIRAARSAIQPRCAASSASNPPMAGRASWACART